jgi:hypothetical protein
MRILACIPYHYYDTPGSTLSYAYTAGVLRRMGHTVHVFEFIEQATENKEGMNDFFLDCVARGGYDLVFVETSKDEFYPDVLDQARQITTTVAWNSDDDWRWETYSKLWAPHFTWMVTTYPHVYEAHKGGTSNLLLSQWGCTGLFDGSHVEKDVEASFVGLLYGQRTRLLNRVQRSVGLEIHTSSARWDPSVFARIRSRVGRTIAGQHLEPVRERLDYRHVNEIWNRSMVSMTPLQASVGGGYQVKGRVFEMGLSGTVMVCDAFEALHRYYEPGVEYLEFESAEECAERIRYLIRNDAERKRMAQAYRRRTLAEHMWEHRWSALFHEIGLG